MITNAIVCHQQAAARFAKSPIRAAELTKLLKPENTQPKHMAYLSTHNA